MAKTCSIDGCDKPHYGRGWCVAHWAKWRKYGDPLADHTRRKPPVCVVEGCQNTKVVGRGLCSAHYHKWQRHGDPLYEKPLKWEGKTCSVEGCDRDVFISGYCQKHYRMYLKYGDASKVTVVFHNGETQHPREYCSWVSMKQRCYNPKTYEYYNYGGRGIKVCDRWLGPYGFVNFYEDMGPRPEGYSLDRIDVDGDYCPENCRWASAKEQSNNTRHNRYITYRGETKTLAEWGRVLGYNKGTLRNRLEHGWDINTAFTTPSKGSYFRGKKRK